MATADGKFAHDNSWTAPAGPVMPLFSLKDKTAIVSGAGAGIGLAVAHALAEAGANVAIWYNSNKKALAEAEEVERLYGVKCRAYQVNVTSLEAIEKAVDDIVTEFNGRLDVFVANSGVAWEVGSFLDADMSHYDKVMKVNVDGVFYCARAAGRHFRRQKQEGTVFVGAKTKDANGTNGDHAIDNHAVGSVGRPLDPPFHSGSFIATSSMSGIAVNIPQLQAAYNASKAAVTHGMRSLAVEWAGFARVNTVSPGYVETELTTFASPVTRGIWKDKTPMGRECQPVELKGAYLYLASAASSYTTGADIVCDGGYTAV